MTQDEQESVVREIGAYAAALLTGLKGIRAERDDNNSPLVDDVPPVQHVLVQLRPGQFVDEVLNRYRARLAKFRTPDEIEAIENEHRCLVKLQKEDATIRAAIDHGVSTTFKDAWDCVPRFKALRSFCGRIATVFPNTTSAESDFSIVKWELDAFRTSLMHLSLEGIMQAKQRNLLKQLWAKASARMLLIQLKLCVNM